MKISIIVPCRNAEAYLAQTLGSALDQTRPPDEIIVVDDGSTDRSLAIAREFADRLPGMVRVFAETSRRAARTRNLGALAASGDALMFLDADDLLRYDALAALTAALAARPDAVAICPWLRLEYREGRWTARPPSCTRRAPGEDPLSAWLTGWYHPPCSVLWSRTAFERAGRWDEQAMVNDDGDLMMRALAGGAALVETSAGAAYYRRHPAGGTSLTSGRLTRDNMADRVRVVRKIARRLEELERIGPYRTPLARSFRLIARDARHRHPELSRESLALARQYRPPVRVRARRALAALLTRSGAALRRAWPAGGTSLRAAGAPFPAEEERDVRWGLDRARDVLNRPPAPAVRRPSRGLERPTVSVIVPTYNRAHVLRRALDSVLAQTYGDLEVLVVDDGSTDETPSVVAEYADSRVRQLRHTPNAGAGAARNHGLRAARGDLIAFLDSDDEWLPAKLARQVSLLRGRPPDVGLVYTGVETVRADGTTRVDLARDEGDVYAAMLSRNVIHGGGSNVMIRRHVVATAGFFREDMRAIEDYEYWLRIARWFEVACIEAPLIRYYDTRGPARRSLDARANLAARWWLYRRQAAEMRRAGAAHRFLLHAARRALAAPEPDVRAARRLALCAVLEAPTSRETLWMLKRTVLRRAGAAGWRRRPPVVESGHG